MAQLHEAAGRVDAPADLLERLNSTSEAVDERGEIRATMHRIARSLRGEEEEVQ
jgi:hypothetical protein